MIGKFPASYIDLCLDRLLEHPWKGFEKPVTPWSRTIPTVASN
jgi:hypothetical protein